MLNAIYSCFAAAGIVLSVIIFGLSANFWMLVGVRGRFIDCHAHWWSRMVAWCAGMKIKRFGAEKVDASRPYVMVCNHRSHFDTTLLYVASPVPVRMLAKRSLFKTPILGLTMKLAGHVPVDRHKGKMDMQQLKKEVQRLIIDAGRTLCVFAEGTRQKPGEFGSYKPGAFQIAVETGLPLLPVSIEDTGRILQAKTLRVHPGTVKVLFHDPIDTSGADLDTLRDQTKKIIEDGCRKLRETT